MISYKKKFIRIVECWNGEAPITGGADLIRRFQQSHKQSGMFCREFFTVLLDLRSDPATIFATMKRNTRYEIRRAETRDNLTYGCWDGSDASVFDEFCAYAGEFLAERRQAGIDRSWLSLLADAGLLELSHIDNGDGEKLVWHAYHRAEHRVTLLYSASSFRGKDSVDFRQAVGRANRFHHWQDMLRFRSAGISTYDFGGWYDGTTDDERLRINKFKEQFGGEVVRNYICEKALTLKGALFLWIRTRLLGNAI
jgi:hypothetical protein